MTAARLRIQRRERYRPAITGFGEKTRRMKVHVNVAVKNNAEWKVQPGHKPWQILASKNFPPPLR